MIKIGDKVKFLNDIGGGVVTGFTGKNTAIVENEDGFEIPYPVSMLIDVNDPKLNRSDEKKEKEKNIETSKPSTAKKKTRTIIKGKDSPDFYFCFVPSNSKNPLADDIELFFVNDSNYNILLRYAHKKDGLFHTSYYGKVVPNSKKMLESIGLNDLGDLPDYFFQLIYFMDEEEQFRSAITKIIKVSSVKFYKEKSYQSVRFFDRNAMIYKVSGNVLNNELDKLGDDDFRKIIRNKEKKSDKVKPPVVKVPEILEIDLHINELTDNSSGLSNKEILDLQKEKVEREMKVAITSGVKRIVFIHGVGQGVLKLEIARLLKSKFPKYSFHDASFKEYGFGATMVILRKG